MPRGPAGDQGRPRWFSRGVAGIGLASFLSDVGHEVPTSLLPSFLTSTLKAPASALGLIEGISDALAGIAWFGGGALAGNPARRRRVAVGGICQRVVGVFCWMPCSSTQRVRLSTMSRVIITDSQR